MGDRAGEAASGAGVRRIGWRQRAVLLAIIAIAVVILAAPPLLQLWMDRGRCPSEVTSHGFAPKARWEIARSDCGAGRIVHQLRIVPPKGGAVVVYEAEGGPRPLSWSQTGNVGRLALERPLDGASSPVIDLDHDKKGRPEAAILVRDGRRLAAP